MHVKKLWVSDIKSLFGTGRKGTFSVKQILFLFSLLFFSCFFFSSFIPNTFITGSFLFGVSRKCLAVQGSEILMPAEHTQLFQLFASQISSVQAVFNPQLRHNFQVPNLGCLLKSVVLGVCEI